MLIADGQPNLPAILKEGTQLSVIIKLKGEQFTHSVLGLLIHEFQSAFNLIRPITDDQAADLAMEFMANWWAYKLEDFVAFLQLAKRGLYGKILDRLDTASVLAMLMQYDAQRVDRLAARQASKQESKQGLNPYAKADRDEQNEGFTDRSVPIGDFIKKVKKLKNNET